MGRPAARGCAPPPASTHGATPPPTRAQIVDAGLHEEPRFGRYLLGGLALLYFGLVPAIYRCGWARCACDERLHSVVFGSDKGRTAVHAVRCSAMLSGCGLTRTTIAAHHSAAGTRVDSPGEWVRRPRARLPGQMAALRAELGDRELLAGARLARVRGVRAGAAGRACLGRRLTAAHVHACAHACVLSCHQVVRTWMRGAHTALSAPRGARVSCMMTWRGTRAAIRHSFAGRAARRHRAAAGPGAWRPWLRATQQVRLAAGGRHREWSMRAAAFTRPQLTACRLPLPTLLPLCVTRR
jgi:hypothetical protein